MCCSSLKVAFAPILSLHLRDVEAVSISKTGSPACLLLPLLKIPLECHNFLLESLKFSFEVLQTTSELLSRSNRGHFCAVHRVNLAKLACIWIELLLLIASQLVKLDLKALELSLVS